MAVPTILEFKPDARFIVMLRNPVELVQSSHSQVLFGLNESVTDFGRDVAVAGIRAKGRCIPKSCLEPAVLQYRQLGMLGDQLSRLFTRVAPDCVKVLLLEDYSADARGTYESVLAFLGVPSDHRSDFPKVNANKTHRRAYRKSCSIDRRFR